jgi:hypothetical protein
MPEPVSRYQDPLADATSTPALCHSATSFLWVPELSPREANGTLASAIILSATAASFMPLTFAGSVGGPTTMKSLYMTSKRSTP